MLGLYNYIANSKAVQSIVRGGLQLFYKADRTQAPLGEEQVRNNSFDEIGGNLVSNPTFDLGSEEVVNVDFTIDSDWTKRNGSTINNVANVIAGGSIGSSSANWSLESLANVFEPSKTYQIKFRAKQVSLAGSNAGTFQVGNSYGALFDEVITSEFVDYTFTAQTSSNYWPKLTIGGRTAGDVFQIDNVSVKEVPNWTLGDGWSIEDSKASLVQVGNPTASDLLYQDITSLVNGKTYSISFDLEISSSATFIGISSTSAFGNLSSSIRGFSDSGTKTIDAIYDSSHQSGIKELRFVGTIGAAFTIDNVSVKQLDPNNRWAVNNDTPSEQTVQIREGSFFIEYDSTATKGVANINVPSAGVLNQKYEIKVVVDSINNDEKLKVQLGNSAHNLSVGVNIFEATSTTSGTLTLGRTNEDDSVTATVSSVSLRKTTNSIKDHSRNSNDGILYSGKALEFDTDDGSNDFIVLNDANLPGEFTVCTWVEPHSFNQCNIFGDDANENWIRIHSALSITVKINDNSSGYAPIAHGGNIALNEWSRVVVTRGSDNIIRFGINGVFYSPSTTQRAGNFNFNRLGVKDGLQMNGALADVQVYDKAWNATDVKYDWENPDKDVFDRVGEAQVLGEELNDLSWVANVGWSINGDIASGTGSTIVNDILELGKTYQFKCKLSSYTSGDFRLMLGGNTISTNFSSTDEFTFIGVCAGDTSARVQSLNGGIGSLLISSLTIKEVTTHASHILPTDCKSLLRLNEGAGDRVYDAAPVLGAEEVTNGDFALDSNWSEGAGWDIDVVNNKATCDGTQTGRSSLFQTGILQQGIQYQFEFTLKDVTSGNVRLRNGIGASEIYISDKSLNDTYIVVAEVIASNQTLVVDADENFEGSVTNISVKEIKPAESFFITGDKNFLHQQPYIPQYAMSSFSKKMVFDGSNDYVNCSSDASIDNIFTGGGTISAWISPTTDGGENLGTIIGKGSVSIRVKEDDNNGVILNLAKGFSTTNADFLTSDEVVLENKMNHIAITYNDSAPSNTPSFYVNGVLKAIDTSSSATPVGSASTDASSNLIIGNATAGGTRSFDGIIDEVSMFKTILTQDEVLELYNSGSSFDSTGHSKYNLGEEVSNGTFELGSEEVVNGDFSDGTTSGWSFSNLTADVSNNTLKLTSTTSADNRAFYDISTQVGKTYQMSVDVKSDASNSISGIGGIGVTNPMSYQDGANAGSFTTLKLIFTATLETTQIRLLNSKAGTWGGLNSVVEFDNISVKEIPNWSFANGWGLNGNTAVYNGTGAQYAKLIQTLSTVVGRTYQMTFTLSGLNSGETANFGLGQSDGAYGVHTQSTYSSNGVHTRVMQAKSTSDTIIIQANQADANFVVSNISVQEYGLSGYWRNNGADQWDDLSINSNHGTVSGSPTEIFLQEVPFFGKDSLGMFMNKPRLGGLNFNSSGYVDTGDPFQSTFRDSFSICFWFKFPDGQPSSAMRFFGHDVGEDELFISLETDGKSKLQFRSNNDRVISKTDAAIASNNQTDWIYSTVTVTKASTIGDAQIIFYKDGSAVNSSLVGTETLTQSNMEAYTQTQNIVLGAFNNDGTIANFCDGIIDDFKIYSKALTAAEIKKNYNATKGRHKN